MNIFYAVLLNCLFNALLTTKKETDSETKEHKNFQKLVMWNTFIYKCINFDTNFLCIYVTI